MSWYRVVALAALLTLGVNAGTVAAEEVQRGDPRVRVILDGLTYKYTVDADNRFRLIFETENGRSQQVYINSRTETIDPFELREIWSPALDVPKGVSGKVAIMLLEDNFKKKMGAWQTVKTSVKGRLAAFTVKLDANADSPTLDAVLQIVVVTADMMEQELSRNDAL